MLISRLRFVFFTGEFGAVRSTWIGPPSPKAPSGLYQRRRVAVRFKRGNSTVTIYKADRKKNGHLYREFKLAYYNEIGKRTLQSFNSFKKARNAADNVNVSLMKGEVKSLVLSNDDKVVYLRALKALKPTGTALDVAAYLFAELVKVLGGASPLEAARYYIHRHPAKLPRKTVQEVVEEFIDSRRGRADLQTRADTLEA